MDIKDTKYLAKKIRLHTLQMTSQAGSSHVGSVFSMADIIAVLYGATLNKDPNNPKWADRDRFILSKGHATSGLYAALAECGFFPVEDLKTFYQDGSNLLGHVSHRVPGVEVSSGSLGHGLPMGAGMAYGAKLDQQGHKVFVLMSDGECDEGSNWEAILFAAHHKLDNLVAIVDYNKIQSLDQVSNTLGLEPFTDKWNSFGWEVLEVDGHNLEELHTAFSNLPRKPNRPTCIIAHTIKGKGVSFMENTVLWHYRSPQGEEYASAVRELESQI